MLTPFRTNGRLHHAAVITSSTRPLAWRERVRQEAQISLSATAVKHPVYQQLNTERSAESKPPSVAAGAPIRGAVPENAASREPELWFGLASVSLLAIAQTIYGGRLGATCGNNCEKHIVMFSQSHNPVVFADFFFSQLFIRIFLIFLHTIFSKLGLFLQNLVLFLADFFLRILIEL